MQPEPHEQSSSTSPRKELGLPLLLMLWPVGLLALCTIGYLAMNAFAAPTEPTGELFGEQSPLQAAGNVLLFFAAGVSILLGPISFIIGLVLLIQRGTKKE